MISSIAFIILFIVCLLAFIGYRKKTIGLKIRFNSKKKCIYKIALFICGLFFILIAAVFLLIAVDKKIDEIIILSVFVGCVMNAVLFFSLSDIAQKVTEMYNNQKNKSEMD